jgi:hypothetical protein
MFQDFYLVKKLIAIVGKGLKERIPIVLGKKDPEC